jgi:hypothetical protein
MTVKRQAQDRLKPASLQRAADVHFGEAEKNGETTKFIRRQLRGD